MVAQRLDLLVWVGKNIAELALARALIASAELMALGQSTPFVRSFFLTWLLFDCCSLGLRVTVGLGVQVEKRAIEVEFGDHNLVERTLLA